MLESVYSIVKMAIQSFLGHVTFLDGKKNPCFDPIITTLAVRTP
jgi:hypothetical protein